MENLPEIIASVKESGNPIHCSQVHRMRITYTLTVENNAVLPEGTVRCWLPYHVPTRSHVARCKIPISASESK